MKKYTLGFAFSSGGEDVVLITKTNPEWQRGFMNGVGGKIEDNESPLACITREFVEETGVRLDEWREFCVITHADFQIHIYRTFSDEIYKCTTTTEERINIIKVSQLNNYKILDNLNWLIPMALKEKYHYKINN